MAASRFRDDLYLLAGLLGRVLRAQAGETAFAVEEEVRALAKASRAGTPGAGDDLQSIVARLTAADAETLVRAFTLYFQLINLCEDNERIRRLRRREAETGEPRRGSLRKRSGCWPTAG
jgi:phosphoenolpyruvate carboxylase